MKKIAVVSGKGGVGKSSITASLAVLLAEKRDLVVVDCDVDASNLSLILGGGEMEREETVSTNEKATFDPEKCTSCGKCKDICTFSAINWNYEKEMPEINKYLCEGCGACELVCPEDAFTLEKVENATIGEMETEYSFPLVAGQLKMGEAGSGKVVEMIKQRAAEKNGELMLIDAAAGIGCPVISALKDVDYVIAVTEPSPAGLSDLKRVMEVVDQFGIDCGFIINKYDLNPEVSDKIENFVKERGSQVLAKIGYDKKFVEALTDLKPVVEREESYREKFEGIITDIDLKEK
ncbi:MAG: P-loop NTPase [Candidatus Aenigmatarchaeota archaeon]